MLKTNIVLFIFGYSSVLVIRHFSTFTHLSSEGWTMGPLEGAISPTQSEATILKQAECHGNSQDNHTKVSSKEDVKYSEAICK